MSSSSFLSKLSVIPDQVLETYICRSCDKYLTVGPITVHPDGGNICGRCNNEVRKKSNCLFECDLSHQIDIPYGIFAYVNHLFPCVNRYEGCKKLLAFNDIATHETTCQWKKFKCGCSHDYEGNGSQQINHFKIFHPSHFFVKKKFHFLLKSNNSTNLIKREDDLFFLYTEIDKYQEQVRFYVKPTKRLQNDIDFFCLLKDFNGEVIDQTTVTRRAVDGIYHWIRIKNICLDDTNMIYCDCLLRKVLPFKNKIESL